MSQAYPPKWSPAGRFGFRFLFVYLILFFFPFPAGLVNPHWLGGLFDPLWARLVPLVAGALGVTIPDANNGGSGDTTYDYVRVLTMLALALGAAAVWSVLDR